MTPAAADDARRDRDEKLERYLDQVCRGIGGPRALRQHMRQELREHLRDAIAEHEAAGMPPAEAIDQALAEFGGPDLVRAELAGTHGYRLTTLLIDKAMHWKEITMKPKWLWTTWAHVALGALIVAEVLFIAAVMLFIMPKVKQIVMDAGVGARGMDELMPMSRSFLGFLEVVADHGVAILLGLAALWAFFEWRVRGENKPLVRLAGMGTIALLLIAAVAMSAAVAMVPLAMVAPNMGARLPERVVSERMASLDASIGALQQAMAQKDWEAIQHVSRARQAADAMAHLGGAAPAIVAASQQPRVDALRAQFQEASQSLHDARAAAWDRDDARLQKALKEFQATYAGLRAAATTRPATP
jgi:hypothetical protein